MNVTFEAAGVAIPKLGLGTYGLNDGNCTRAVADGIAAGYRHVDTAEMYQNEAAVGAGIRASGVARDEIFVTTKVWHDHLGDGILQAAAEASLARLGLDHVDLYLIHWPNADVPLAETIGALNEVRRRGFARAIGVSNFPVALLDEAVAASRAPLAVNQVEFHPFIDQTKVLAALERHAMGLIAYCPLARGAVVREPVLSEIAGNHGVSPAVVTLAWAIGHPEVIAIPKSASTERMSANLAALDLTLTADERAAIDALRRPDGRLIDPSFAPRWDAAA